MTSPPPPAYSEAAPTSTPVRTSEQHSAQSESQGKRFTIHRAGGGSSKDLFALDPLSFSSNTLNPPIAYYFSVPSMSIDGPWRPSFHRGDITGPVIAEVKKGYFARHFKLELLNIDDRKGKKEIELEATSRFKYVHEVKGEKGTYEWTMDGKDLKCREKVTGSQVAFWRNVDATKTNKGYVDLNSGYDSDMELILLTGFILQERWTEKQEGNARAALAG